MVTQNFFNAFWTKARVKDIVRANIFIAALRPRNLLNLIFGSFKNETMYTIAKL